MRLKPGHHRRFGFRGIVIHSSIFEFKVCTRVVKVQGLQAELCLLHLTDEGVLPKFAVLFKSHYEMHRMSYLEIKEHKAIINDKL